MPVSHLEELYRECGPAVWAYLRRLGHNRDEADDLLQETFVQLARDLQRVEQADSQRAWVFAVARNVSATAFRRRRPTGLSDHAAAQVAESKPNESGAVAEVLAGLSDRDREILELRLLQELDYSEIAIALAIPIGTVRSRLHYSLRRLRAALRPGNEAHIGVDPC